MIAPSACPQWQTDSPGQTAGERNKAARSYTTAGGTIDDRTIDPDLERFMAKRMGAITTEVKASHLSLISHPQEIAELILQAAGRR